jgi:hypothetical protein
MATGEPKTNFSGGFEANAYVSKRGLSVVSLQSGTTVVDSLTIRDSLEAIMTRYASARANEPLGGNELRSTFKGVSDAIATSGAVSRRPTVVVKPSMGQGNWAAVPWISLLDTRETGTTQRGVYCVYLFRQDMSGVYLTLNQGVTEPKNRLGKVKAHEFLRQNAADLRRLCGGLLEHGFRLDEEINLSADSGLGSDYESSTIAYKLYEVDAVPDDEDLLDDLEAVLRAYDRYLADAKWREVVDLCRTMLSDRAELDEEIQYKLKIVEQTPADHRRRQYCATKRRRPRPPTALGRRQANTPPPVELIRGYHLCTVRFRLCCTQGLGHLYQLSSERIAPNAPRSLA